jgi:hypothetical protein
VSSPSPPLEERVGERRPLLHIAVQVHGEKAMFLNSMQREERKEKHRWALPVIIDYCGDVCRSGDNQGEAGAGRVTGIIYKPWARKVII